MNFSSRPFSLLEAFKLILIKVRDSSGSNCADRKRKDLNAKYKHLDLRKRDTSFLKKKNIRGKAVCFHIIHMFGNWVRACEEAIALCGAGAYWKF